MVGVNDVFGCSFQLCYLGNNTKPVWNEKDNFRVFCSKYSRMADDYFCLEPNNGLLISDLKKGQRNFLFLF